MALITYIYIYIHIYTYIYIYIYIYTAELMSLHLFRSAEFLLYVPRARSVCCIRFYGEHMISALGAVCAAADALGTLCTECPPGTYSRGFNRDACLTCPFGTSSGAGSSSITDCRRVAQECPAGMAAPPVATSAAECGCLPGYGIANPANPSAGCAVCPVGTYSPGGTAEACAPCGFGLTSPASSTDITDCYPLDLVCPPGMEIPGGGTGSSNEECQCKPGFGKSMEAPCMHGIIVIAQPGFGHSCLHHREECCAANDVSSHFLELPTHPR
jgi:hypothetical protein